ncbi:notchless protein homolog 1, partial [Caerostris extrusa]
ETDTSFLFFVNDVQVKDSLKKVLEKKHLLKECIVDITYAEQAPFHVRPVTRCTSSIPGHAEAVISAIQYSKSGWQTQWEKEIDLISASFDTTVRLWDVDTETPQFTCKGHKHWVLCIAWSPNGLKLASGCKNGLICIWDPRTGKQIGKALSGHRGWINAISWEPCTEMELVVTLPVLPRTALWGGNGLIYSGSQDRNIKVFRGSDGVLCRTLKGHAHWVNSIALNTDYVIRTGSFDPRTASFSRPEITDDMGQELAVVALKRYESATSGRPEIMVSGSDDFSMMLWSPEKDSKCIARMTGHHNLINDVKFSPDMRFIATASFDKSIKLWNGKTGKYISSLYGHVQQVYQIAWSSDSRLLVSGSADSTLKVWDMKTYKIMIDLPGHADEIYAVDWSPDGQRVASGGKDKVIKM